MNWSNVRIPSLMTACGGGALRSPPHPNEAKARENCGFRPPTYFHQDHSPTLRRWLWPHCPAPPHEPMGTFHAQSTMATHRCSVERESHWEPKGRAVRSESQRSLIRTTGLTPLSWLLDFIDLPFGVCMPCRCLCATCMPGAQERQNCLVACSWSYRQLRPCCLGTGTWNQVLWKSSVLKRGVISQSQDYLLL